MSAPSPNARLRAARECVARSRALLLRPSPPNLETCARLFREARGLAMGLATAGPGERAEAAALLSALESAAPLARQAAAAYLELARLGGAGSRDYTASGAAAAPAAVRQLAEA